MGMQCLWYCATLVCIIKQKKKVSIKIHKVLKFITWTMQQWVIILFDGLYMTGRGWMWANEAVLSVLGASSLWGKWHTGMKKVWIIIILYILSLLLLLSLSLVQLLHNPSTPFTGLLQLQEDTTIRSKVRQAPLWWEDAWQSTILFHLPTMRQPHQKWLVVLPLAIGIY